MTADFIAFHAAERPDAVALIERGREVTYRQFHRDLGRFVGAVAEFGLKPGSTAAIAWGELYPHWLLLLACERLGIATATFVPDEGAAGARLLETIDLVLSETRPPEVSAERHLSLTPKWLADAFGRADAEIPLGAPTQPDDPLRILRTSGTTGAPKRLLMTRRMLEAHVRRWAWSIGITRASRSIVNVPFSVNGSYTLSTAVIRMGGAMYYPGPEIGTAAALAGPARGATHLRVPPLELKLILDTLPPNFVKPASLTVCTVGAPLAAVLRERALALLATEVVVSYACNEIPFVAVTRGSGSEGIATVYPWVDVETVDEQDLPVPPGTIGTLRLREPAMAQGYLDDPETTARKFRNGWFYPGDLGILHGPKRLQIVGREDEIINLGGIKLAPNMLEAWVQRHASVGDIGICTLPNPDGVEEICVAVANSAHGDAELLARVGEAFRHNHVGDFFVVKVPRVPRNANGKIERGRLREMAAAARRR